MKWKTRKILRYGIRMLLPRTVPAALLFFLLAVIYLSLLPWVGLFFKDWSRKINFVDKTAIRLLIGIKIDLKRFYSILKEEPNLLEEEFFGRTSR